MRVFGKAPVLAGLSSLVLAILLTCTSVIFAQDTTAGQQPQKDEIILPELINTYAGNMDSEPAETLDIGALMYAEVLANNLADFSWQQIASQSDLEWFDVSNLIIGNFDEDSDEEILLSLTEDLIIEQDGSVGRFPRRETEFFSPDFAYDFDGDGIDDLCGSTYYIADSSSTNGKSIQVHNLQHELIGEFPGESMGPQILMGDFNGDGAQEPYVAHVLEYHGDNPAAAFGVHGEMLFELGPEWNSPYLLAGDVDGDGLDEVISFKSVAAEDYPALLAAGLNQAETRLRTESGLNTLPDFFVDVNGDGTDEVTMMGQLLDIANGTTVPLEWPYNCEFPHFDGLFAGNVCRFELNNTGYMAALLEFDVMYRDLNNWDYPMGLGVWSADGSLVYLEKFGEPVLSLRSITKQGCGRLAVLTQSRLLISP